MNTFQNQMEKSGQRSIVLYLWEKNSELKRLVADMKQILDPDADSNAQIARWAQRL
jgi:hypothetical protein